MNSCIYNSCYRRYKKPLLWKVWSDTRWSEGPHVVDTLQFCPIGRHFRVGSVMPALTYRTEGLYRWKMSPMSGHHTDSHSLSSALGGIFLAQWQCQLSVTPAWLGAEAQIIQKPSDNYRIRLGSYWVGQKVHLEFSITSNRKTQQSFWPTQYYITKKKR